MDDYKEISKLKRWRNAPFLTVAIIYPVLPILTWFVIFPFAAFNQFPGRYELYRFVGWSLIPMFTILGFFIEIAIVVITIKMMKKRRLALLPGLGIILLNIVLYNVFFFNYVSSA